MSKVNIDQAWKLATRVGENLQHGFYLCIQQIETGQKDPFGKKDGWAGKQEGKWAELVWSYNKYVNAEWKALVSVGADSQILCEVLASLLAVSFHEEMILHKITVFHKTQAELQTALDIAKKTLFATDIEGEFLDKHDTNKVIVEHKLGCQSFFVGVRAKHPLQVTEEMRKNLYPRESTPEDFLNHDPKSVESQISISRDGIIFVIGFYDSDDFT